MNALRGPCPADGFGWEEGPVEKGPEERDEEHDFGGDEKRHAEAQTGFCDFVMNFFGDGFEYDVFPPEEHDGENGKESNDGAF